METFAIAVTIVVDEVGDAEGFEMKAVISRWVNNLFVTEAEVQLAFCTEPCFFHEVFECSFAFNVDVEEYCEIYAPPTSGTFPYSGTPIDGLPARGCKFSELPKPGGLRSYSVTWPGGSVGDSATISSSSYQGPDVHQYDVSLDASWASWTHSLLGTSVVASVSLLSQGLEVSANDVKGEVLGGDVPHALEYDFSNPSELYLRVYNTGEPLGGPYPSSYHGNLGSASLSGTNLVKYNFKGTHWKTFSDDYSGGDLIPVTVATHWRQQPGDTFPSTSEHVFEAGGNGGSISSAYKKTGDGYGPHREYSFSFQPKNGNGPCVAYLSGTQLYEAGEDPGNTRIQFYGLSWDAFSIQRDSSFVVNACESQNGWDLGADTSISVQGGHVVISSFEDDGFATLSLSGDKQRWETFRYLKVAGFASQACTVYLKIAGQTWSVLLGTTAGDHFLDLCCAPSDVAQSSVKRSRFPVTGSTIDSNPQVNYALGWGVDTCSQIEVAGLPAGTQIHLMGFTLVLRDQESALTLVPPFRVYPSMFGGSQYVQPYAFIQADGRSTDWPGYRTAGFQYGWYSIEEFASLISWLPAVSATALAPLGDGVHDSEYEAFVVGGSGATYDWSTEEWTEWIDKPISSSPTTIPAQDLFDAVEAYPGIGNPWDGSAYPDPAEDEGIPLVSKKFIRGQATGLVFSDLSTALVPIDLSAFSQKGPFVGGGVTAANGSYRTGAPFGPGNVTTATGVVGPDVDIFANAVWQDGFRQRVSFRLPPVPCAGADPRNPWSCGSGTLNVAVGPNCAVAVGCDCEQPEASSLPMPGLQ